MRRPTKTQVRALFAAVLLCSAGAVAGSYATAEENVAAQYRSDDPGTAAGSTATSTPPSGGPDGAPPNEPEERLAGDVPPGEITVVGTQGFYVSDEQAELVAFDRSGRVVFYDDAYRVYFDVDPVPGKPYTVEYLASEHRDGAACANVSTPRCTYNVYNRVNLSTGETTEVYGETTARIYSARWHDVDRVNETHVAVADILRDSLRLVNTTTDETVWEWNASEHFAPDVGGNDGDWTHINDVEVLDDGRYMVSVRNMDRVVFVEPGEGADANWTLGTEDDYDVLYEQHNPDYIPPEQGGPAITVADSENGRVLEYQRVDPETGEPTTAADGEWRRTWGWRDSRLQWPRDADRLPNGNTLIVDTHGDRVAEVAPDGTVAWSRTVGMPYDVERLGTGDESAGGNSTLANQAEDGEPATAPQTGAEIARPDLGPSERVWLALKGLTPSLIVNGMLFASPSWVRFTDLAFGAVFVAAGLTWGATEVRWSRYSVRGLLRSLRRRD